VLNIAKEAVKVVQCELLGFQLPRVCFIRNRARRLKIEGRGLGSFENVSRGQFLNDVDAESEISSKQRTKLRCVEPSLPGECKKSSCKSLKRHTAEVLDVRIESSKI
jgi:hypothetical protein